MKKNDMNSHCVLNLHFGQKSPWTKVSLDKSLLGLMYLGKRSLWTTVPWTNVATPTTIFASKTILRPGFSSKIVQSDTSHSCM